MQTYKRNRLGFDTTKNKNKEGNSIEKSKRKVQVLLKHRNGIECSAKKILKRHAKLCKKRLSKAKQKAMLSLQLFVMVFQLPYSVYEWSR